jgi:hypothetical protein
MSGYKPVLVFFPALSLFFLRLLHHIFPISFPSLDVLHELITQCVVQDCWHGFQKFFTVNPPEVLFQQQHKIRIILCLLLMTASSRKRVGFRMLLPRFMDEREVVFAELQRPPGLLSIEFLCRGEVLQILVVRPNFELQLTALQIVSPLVEGPHNRQHFLVVDLVVSFGVG